MRVEDLPFAEIWMADTEYVSHPGEHPIPVCYCAREWRSGRIIRLFQSELPSECPFRTDADVLYVSFVAAAELTIHLALGWRMPARVLDLHPEFRWLTNGIITPGKDRTTLIAALGYFNLGHIDATEKTEMRDLILSGGPYSGEDRAAILDYCMSDVVALERLLPNMLSHIDLPRALIRGWYSGETISNMVWNGVPIDAVKWWHDREWWTDIQDDLVSEIDARYGVFTGREVNPQLFEAYLARNDIPWPRLASGRLRMDDDAFKVMSEIYPVLTPLRQARQASSVMRLSGLVVGSDGRNRCWLNPFGALTGRNQPSNKEFIFGPATWMRSFIKPEEGNGIAYLDLSCAEFGIAAKLSEDPVMMQDYRDDAHLGLGKKAGIVPLDATKKTHGRERDALKPCNLGLLYVMGPKTLASRLAGFDTPYPDSLASYLWQTHHESYSKFWEWSDACVDHAMLLDFLQTPLGWRMTTKLDVNPNTLRNFPVQGTCADILRLACCLGVRRGVEICCPVHDAVLIHASLDRLDEDVETMRACFAEASRIVLDGFELKTGVEFFRYPERYVDPRGIDMWNRIETLMDGLDGRRLQQA